MNPVTVTAIVIAAGTGLIGLLITVLTGIIAFGGRRFIDHLDKLDQSMRSLETSVMTLSDKFVTRDEHEKDIESIRNGATSVEYRNVV